MQTRNGLNMSLMNMIENFNSVATMLLSIHMCALLPSADRGSLRPDSFRCNVEHSRCVAALSSVFKQYIIGKHNSGRCEYCNGE